MQKTRFRLSPAIFSGIGIIFIVAAALCLQIYGSYYLKFSQKVHFSLHEEILFFVFAAIGILLVLIGIIKIKNLQVTRWILFGISLLGALLLLLLMLEIHISRYDFVFFAVGYSIFIPLIVLPLVFKKHKWTKILLITGTSLFLAVCLAGLIFIFGNKSYSYDKWEMETVVLKDYNNPSRIVVYQYSANNARYVVETKVFPAIYDVDVLYDKVVPLSNWEIVDDQLAGELNIPNPVKTKEDILYGLSEGKFHSFILTDNIVLDDPLLVAGARKLSLFGKSEDSADTSTLAGNLIIIKNSHNIILQYLNIDGMLRFENCSNIKIANCKFLRSNKSSLYFDDNCSYIDVSNNEFNHYTSCAIDAPYATLTVNYNSYNNDDGTPDTYSRTNIRDFFNNIPMDKFYSKLICEHADYCFSSPESSRGEDDVSYNSLGNCSIGIYDTDYGFTDFTYPLYQYFSDIFSTININNYGLFEYLRAFSNEVEPLTERPLDYNNVSEDGLSFYRINPVFIKWWARTMIPDPQASIGNTTFQALYDDAFAYPVRLFAETYLWLHTDENFPEELKWYKEKAKENKYDLVDILQKRYDFVPLAMDFTQSESDKYSGIFEDTGKNIGMMTGFWMRRNIDGSDKAIFEAAINILENYDPNFKQYLSENYSF